MSNFPPIDAALAALGKVNWKKVGATALTIAITTAVVIAVVATLIYRGVKNAIAWYNNGGKEQLIDAYTQAVYVASSVKESVVIAWDEMETAREKVTTYAVNVWWAKIEPIVENVVDVVQVLRARQFAYLG